MHTQPRLGRFLLAATAASLLAGFTPDTFAQGAGQTDPAAGQNATAAPAYELEITNGHLAGSAKPKANAPAKPATLGNAIDLLRELHPEANFVLAAGLDRSVIADLKLRAASVEDQLEALRIASGSQFGWRAGNSGAVNPGAIDPTTGVPVSSGGKPNPTLYVLSPSPTAKPVLQVEAFNISGYVDSLQAKATSAKQIQEQLDQIQAMVDRTINQYNDLTWKLDGARPKSLQPPLLQFHRGANLEIIIGEPDAVAVAAKVIGALPGAQRSVASEDPSLRLGDPFQGFPGGGGGIGAGSGGMGMGSGSGRGGGGGGLGAGSMGAGGMSGNGAGGALGGRGAGIGSGGAGGGGVSQPNRP